MMTNMDELSKYAQMHKMTIPNGDSGSSSGGSAPVSPWAGKKWYAYGTSLTAGQSGTHYSYAPILAQKLGVTMTNKGKGGSGITASASDQTNMSRMTDLTDGKLNADLITLEVGANDGSADVGDIDDDDDTTFCGALNVILKTLAESKYTGRLCVIPSTPGRYSSSSTDHTPYDPIDSSFYTKYLDRLEKGRQICSKWHVPYLNANDINGISPYHDMYYADNIHLTQAGANRQADALYSLIKNISPIE